MILQFVVNGCITGILYSLLGIGFSLVYNTTKIFHISAAALYVIAAYGFYFFSDIMSVAVWLAFLLSLCMTMAASLLIELVVYRPLRNKKASLNVMMISSIGVMTVLVNIIAMCFGNEIKVIDNSIQTPVDWGMIIITRPQLYQLYLGIIFIAAFLLFMSKSRFGVRIRALSSDDTLFEILGYRTSRMRDLVFLFSGFFIALASCLTVYDTGLNPHMGMNVLINAIVAMVIGGIGNYRACILGGLSLGILQSLVAYQFSSHWQNAITFLMLLLFLFLRPQGIAGYKRRMV